MPVAAAAAAAMPPATAVSILDIASFFFTGGKGFGVVGGAAVGTSGRAAARGLCLEPTDAAVACPSDPGGIFGIFGGTGVYDTALTASLEGLSQHTAMSPTWTPP